MKNWDPDQYLRFSEERTQPSKDLAAKIPLEAPGKIVDIGCGPGNSTQVLRTRWPQADITGLDSSEKMIERARADYPGQTWIVGDAMKLEGGPAYDLVFSNAALQWMKNHEVLIPRLFAILRNRGVLAVQVPANQESPLYNAIVTVSQRKKWSSFTAGCRELIHYRTAEYYYAILANLSPDLALWETIYYHVLKSHRDLIEWYRGTGMRPYLERLPADKDREAFEQEVLNECRPAYPMQADGSILYPFKRLFFTVRKR